ncbi:MAG TPA: 3-isopropylmalate dehydrogenase [Blastocatellia bacterium]|nr:3-isopropylmalate dehydrogenase [Blastocatellia bacterium]
MKRVAVIAGDGIGPEVVREAVLTIEAAQQLFGLEITLTSFDWSADKYLATGISMPEGALDMLASEYDAILTGAFGDPRVKDNKHAADILLGMRFGLDLYINLRPIKLIDARLCPLKDRAERDVDFVVFRENTEGLYTFMGGNFKRGTADEIAVQEEVNTRKGVERIITAAFDYARVAGRKRVTMSDKSNVLTYGHDLWQRVFKEVAARYSDIEANHLYVDVLTMWMALDPARFDVIVTNNLFGDIITDLGAALQGGLGMAASGNIHPGRVSLFEPVHGSAPQFAGKNVANPVAAILTASMLMDYVGYKEAAAAIERAVEAAVRAGETTTDIGGQLSTAEAGEAVRRHLREAAGQ